MKPWAVLTVALYNLILILLTVPLVMVYGLEWFEQSGGPGRPGWEMTIDFAEGLGMYQQWGYWVWLAVMLSGHALLLLVPLRVAERRLVPRRKLLVPIAVSTFFLALIFSGAVFSIACAIFKDDAFEPFEFMGEQSAANPLLVAALKHFGITASSDFFAFSSILGVIGLCWLVWLLVFYHYAKDDEAGGLTRRITRWLLRGSILELLVAVPSHIIVRRRDDCCAPLGTFWGIVTGLSIMLLAFGPGVFFLFAERFRRLRPRTAPPIEGGGGELP